MDNCDDSARAALRIIRQWQEQYIASEGGSLEPAMSLGRLVNRLALEGVARPQDAILHLLCRGILQATGDYRWHRYQWGHQYSLEGDNEYLKKEQWVTLLKIINSEPEEIKKSDFSFFELNFLKINPPSGPRYSWNFKNNAFFTATLSYDLDINDKNYFEEWFSVEGIKVFAPSLNALDPDIGSAPIAQSTYKGGRPLAEWWPDFVAELVAYTVEIGLPPGIGHQGQSDVIREVSARMQERGKDEPSRSQVQEVVNAVLRRMRSAGN